MECARRFFSKRFNDRDSITLIIRFIHVTAIKGGIYTKPQNSKLRLDKQLTKGTRVSRALFRFTGRYAHY